jgi:hypothetical protein
MTAPITFTRDDLEQVADVVVDAWRTGIDADWSRPAGILDWSCTRTADHTVDSVHAIATFLASRKQDGYPEWGGLTMGPSPRPAHLVEGLATVCRILSGVIAAAGPDERAVIWRFPEVEVRGPGDFAPRGALELLLHGHDVAAGLGVVMEPPADVCARLIEHTRGWPHWSSPGWSPAMTTEDPWGELLRASGRGRPQDDRPPSA